MPNWFSCKIKIDRHQEDGSLKKVTEQYLVNALSFTEAEARITEYLNEEGAEEINIPNIAKANFSDIFPDELGEIWYKAKVSFVSIDENAGKEKKISQFMLVQAEDFPKAIENLLEQFKGFTVPYDIISVAETAILDVIPSESDSAEPETGF